MVRKPIQEAISVAKSFNGEKFLKKFGVEKEDHAFFKQVGKMLLSTYAIFGTFWLWNKGLTLGWFTPKSRNKEEKERANLNEGRKFRYPGEKKAMDVFVPEGGMAGTTIEAEGFVDSDKDSVSYQKELQDKEFKQEALKLWLRMRNEVVSEIQEKGVDVV